MFHFFLIEQLKPTKKADALEVEKKWKHRISAGNCLEHRAHNFGFRPIAKRINLLFIIVWHYAPSVSGPNEIEEERWTRTKTKY